MHPVEQLINNTEPGWTLVKQWIDSAKNKVEILAVDTAKAKDALFKTQGNDTFTDGCNYFYDRRTGG